MYMYLHMYMYMYIAISLGEIPISIGWTQHFCSWTPPFLLLLHQGKPGDSAGPGCQYDAHKAGDHGPRGMFNRDPKKMCYGRSYHMLSLSIPLCIYIYICIVHVFYIMFFLYHFTKFNEIIVCFWFLYLFHEISWDSCKVWRWNHMDGGLMTSSEYIRNWLTNVTVSGESLWQCLHIQIQPLANCRYTLRIAHFR